MDLLLTELRRIQKKEGFVSEKSMKLLSKKLKIPISKVYGAATFYAMMHVKKQGRNVIEICNSPSCYLNGSLDLIKFLEKKLKIKSRQTTKDGRFCLHICSCIGCCDKSPSMKINGKVYSNLTEKKILEILKTCRS